MEEELGTESTHVHSPRVHYQVQLAKKSESESSDSGGSDVSVISDLVVDDVSKFEGLSNQRRKSGGSDYRSQSVSNSASESESSSTSNSTNGSYSEGSTPLSQKRSIPSTRQSEDDSEGTSSRSLSIPPHYGGVQQGRMKISPVVRKSPLSVAHRPAPSEVTAMRGYRYSMLPSRSAAMNVSYSRYLEAESDSDNPPVVSRKKVKKQSRQDSESEFEVGGRSDESASEEMSKSDDDFSEEEYQPPRRKNRGSRKEWLISGSDSDYQPSGGKRQRKGGGGRRAATRRKNDGYTHSFVSDGATSGSGSESEFEPGYASKQGKKKKQRKAADRDNVSPSDYVRTTGRSKGVVSYTNFYGSDVGGSDDGDGGEELEEGVDVVPPVEDNREGIERILKKRTGRVGDTGDKTTCYAQCLEAGSDPAVLSQIGRGNKDSIAKLQFSFSSAPPSPGGLSEVQYLVKWQKWSHLHNTWESEASLTSRDIKGLKKFYNFLKREEEREVWENTASLEDIEYVKCQEELGEQLLVNLTQVERVIASRASEGGEGKEYLCKWRGLPYSECTWEDSGLISTWFQAEIDSFIERNASDRIPNKNAKVLRHRPKFVYMKEQLKSLGGNNGTQLRDYQLEGVNWLVKSWCKDNSVILADEMGLGKTIQTIAYLHFLFHRHQLYGPYLVVVPLSTLPAWQREFELWAPEMNTVMYIGDVNSRNKIREFEWSHLNRKLKFNTMLTTYEILLKDKEFLGSVAWTALIVDEAHRLKNDDSLLYRTLMAFRTNYRLLITGTPLQNSLKELWSLLHFIMERKFPNWEDFEYDNQAYGEGDASSLTSIHQQLQPFLLRRMKKDVEKSLPAKMEQILRVEMSSVQKQYYRWILAKNYKALSKGVKGSITGFINIMMELKKCCNHVWIVRSPDEKEEQEKDKLQTLIRGSGKLYLLDKLLVRLNKTGHRVLIFSQMVRMLDVLADYMRLRHFHFQRLDGSIRGDSRKDAIDHFNAEGSNDFCFLLSTRAGGLGVNLATADTVVIFDSDWNPQNDLQAQARAHRIGQKKQVNIYRLMTKNSVEEDIIERAKKKMVLDHLVIQRMDTTGRTVLSANHEPSKSVPFDKEELDAILKFGTEELFKSGDSSGGSEDKALQEMDIDDILRRAETQATTEEDTSHSDLLSQFKVASFAMDEDQLVPPPSATPTEGKTFLLSPKGCGQAPVVRMWDELIPEEARKMVDEEEKTKEQLDLYLPPRRRKVRNYCEDQHGSSSKTRSRNAQSAEVLPGGASTVVSKNIRGFTDAEIRRFVKSYRKFVNPKTRIEAIAADAELQEKSMTELQRLMTVLQEGCVQAEEQHRTKIETDPRYDPKKDKGASLRLSGVTVGSGALLRREEELAALACVLPANPAVRKKYRLLSRPKSVSWSGIKWTAVDDAKLLIGIYDHGLGNWESIRDDLNLGLSSKILRSEHSLKPQASHLQTRAEYLLKLLQGEAAEKMRKKSSKNSSRSSKKSVHAASRTPAKSKKTSRSHGSKAPPPHAACPSHSHLTVNISRDLLDGEQDSDTGSNASSTRTSRRRRAATSKSHLPPAKRSHLSEEQARVRSSPRRRDKVFIPGERTSPRKRTGRGNGKGPGGVVLEEMEENGDLDEEGGVELDEDTFQKCKVIMKPLKKSMLELEPSEHSAEGDLAAMDHFKEVLEEIGDHITASLDTYKLEDSSLWKMNLWIFVSKFTKVTPQKLRRIYKKAKKMADTSNTSNPPLPVKTKPDEVTSSSVIITSQPLHDQPLPPSHGQPLPPSHDQGCADPPAQDKHHTHSSGKSADQADNVSRHKYVPHSNEESKERNYHSTGGHSTGGHHSSGGERSHRGHHSSGGERSYHSTGGHHSSVGERSRHPSGGERSHHHLSGKERSCHPGGGVSDHSETRQRDREAWYSKDSYHHHGNRRRHSSGSSYHSDGGSGSKRARYHSPPHHSHHKHNSHAH